jgi:hypothetical protein
MEFQVVGPSGGFVFTHVRAAGRGAASDADRLQRELEVAIRGSEILFDAREAEELGASVIEALARVSQAVDGWPTGRLSILAMPGDRVWDELQRSELADMAKHPRVDISAH